MLSSRRIRAISDTTLCSDFRTTTTSVNWQNQWKSYARAAWSPECIVHKKQPREGLTQSPTISSCMELWTTGCRPDAAD